MIAPLICPYCGQPPELVTGDILYQHRPELAEKRFWLCQPCNAYVGTHAGTEVPLGTLANRALRKARMQAHQALDPLWQDGSMPRVEVYKWLAVLMGIHRKEAHIALFDEAQCALVVQLVRDRKPV